MKEKLFGRVASDKNVVNPSPVQSANATPGQEQFMSGNALLGEMFQQFPGRSSLQNAVFRCAMKLAPTIACHRRNFEGKTQCPLGRASSCWVFCRHAFEHGLSNRQTHCHASLQFPKSGNRRRNKYLVATAGSHAASYCV